jgi:hypothetical protein
MQPSYNASDNDEGIGKSAGIGFSPGTRFVYESVDAAKSLLIIVNNYISPGDTFAHFPIRFLL